MSKNRRYEFILDGVIYFDNIGSKEEAIRELMDYLSDMPLEEVFESSTHDHRISGERRCKNCASKCPHCQNYVFHDQRGMHCPSCTCSEDPKS